MFALVPTKNCMYQLIGEGRDRGKRSTLLTEQKPNLTLIDKIQKLNLATLGSQQLKVK